MIGSIRPLHLDHVLDALNVNGRELIDFGVVDGRVLVASFAQGAGIAHGYELPANVAHQFVLNTVLEKIGGDATVATVTPASYQTQIFHA